MFGMSDGRFLTDYRPRCVVDAKIMKDNGISNNTSYRAFLQHNATQLLQQQYQRDVQYSQEAALPCSCADCTRIQMESPAFAPATPLGNGALLPPPQANISDVIMGWLRRLFGAHH